MVAWEVMEVHRVGWRGGKSVLLDEGAEELGWQADGDESRVDRGRDVGRAVRDVEGGLAAGRLLAVGVVVLVCCGMGWPGVGYFLVWCSWSWDVRFIEPFVLVVL
jgi:hypothetical protein